MPVTPPGTRPSTPVQTGAPSGDITPAGSGGRRRRQPAASGTPEGLSSRPAGTAGGQPAEGARRRPAAAPGRADAAGAAGAAEAANGAAPARGGIVGNLAYYSINALLAVIIVALRNQKGGPSSEPQTLNVGPNLAGIRNSITAQPHADPACYPQHCIDQFVNAGGDPEVLAKLADRAFHAFVQKNGEHIAAIEGEDGDEPDTLAVNWVPAKDAPKPGVYGWVRHSVAESEPEDHINVVPEAMSAVPHLPAKDKLLEVTVFHEAIHRFTDPNFFKAAQRYNNPQLETMMIEAMTVGLEAKQFPSPPGQGGYEDMHMSPQDMRSQHGEPINMRQLSQFLVKQIGEETVQRALFQGDPAAIDKVTQTMFTALQKRPATIEVEGGPARHRPAPTPPPNHEVDDL
jgi:hypothetical protein